MGVAAGVGEPRGRGVAKPEGACEERGHRGAVDRPVRAVPQRLLPAADGDAEVSETLDVGRPPLVDVDVRESGLRYGRGFAVTESPAEPHGHLPAFQRLAGADEPVAAFGASQVALGGQRFEARLVHAAVIVAEGSRRGLHSGVRGCGRGGERGRHHGQRQCHRGDPPGGCAAGNRTRPDSPCQWGDHPRSLNHMSRLLQWNI